MAFAPRFDSLLLVVFMILVFNLFVSVDFPVSKAEFVVYRFAAGSLTQGRKERVESTIFQKKPIQVSESELLSRRMDIEINDYPSSGANNRHSRIPQTQN